MCSKNLITTKVFISYSWTVQDKTLELADRLLANGIDVIIDVYDLQDGQDKYVFMEKSVNDPSIYNVLIICDKTYAEKANNREGGVGDETVIITPEIYGNAIQTKFLPIILEKDEAGSPYCPNYIKSRIYIDLSDEKIFESEYEKLLRDLYRKPRFQKPALGRQPEWLENESVDLSALRDVIRQIKSIEDRSSTKADFLFRRASDDFIKTAKQYKVAEKNDLSVEFLKLLDQSKPYRDLFVDYCETLICSEFQFSDIIVSFFEQLYNALHDATGRMDYRDHDLEFSDFIIWEFFIDLTALLLHFEKYKELHDILMHPYYLRANPQSNDFDFQHYSSFMGYFHVIENICKPKSPKPQLFTLAGNIILNRERIPVLTSKSICNADLVLYQLATILTPFTENKSSFPKWFPTTYVYHNGTQQIWHKLKSRKCCLKIAPLFGVNSISELKSIVQQSPNRQDIHYPGSFKCAPGILSSISVNDIGTLP